jgi:hypothetical protein
MIYILLECSKNINKNLKNCQEALKKLENYKIKNTIQVDFPIYDLINEIEENNLLKGDLAENLAELEICDSEENIGYEEEILDKEFEEEVVVEKESIGYEIAQVLEVQCD